MPGRAVTARGGNSRSPRAIQRRLVSSAFLRVSRSPPTHGRNAQSLSASVSTSSARSR